jgi:mannose-6-phosphate isomerase-like protein (cupin superfamily)
VRGNPISFGFFTLRLTNGPSRSIVEPGDERYPGNLGLLVAQHECGRLIVEVFRALLLVAITASATASAAPTETSTPTAHAAMIMPAYVKFDDLKWEKLVPELGANSAEITILHVDPKTGATQLMIRSPGNYHAAKHWHSANETHVVLSGTFIMQDTDGRRAELGPGSFNYMPAGMVHEAWSKPDEGNLVFITVDGPWDLNLVDGPNAKAPPSK